MTEAKLVTLKDLTFKSYISYPQIQSKVKEIATAINKDLAGKSPVFIAVLNGSFAFAADLLKEITINCEISFVKLASYKGVKSSGPVRTLIGLDTELQNRDIIIIEDIVDTGKTLFELLKQLKMHSPAQIKIASLLVKPDALLHHIKVDYTGFEVPDKFLVGYGLDYDGFGRNLKDIYQLSS